MKLIPDSLGIISRISFLTNRYSWHIAVLGYNCVLYRSASILLAFLLFWRPPIDLLSPA